MKAERNEAGNGNWMHASRTNCCLKTFDVVRHAVVLGFKKVGALFLAERESQRAVAFFLGLLAELVELLAELQFALVRIVPSLEVLIAFLAITVGVLCKLGGRLLLFL